MGGRRVAAFFDVDGTIVKTNIVHYYIYFRRQRMSPLLGGLWLTAYSLRCGYYLVLDKISRTRLNLVFYRDYAGLPVDSIKAMAENCYRDVIAPYCFQEATACIGSHREAGAEIVLVTGSVDFIMEPLARRLDVDHMLAPSLVESNGRFTGALNGPPIGEEEKARQVRQYAQAHDIDLSQSHAYGDSIADLPMLEAVGHPHVVNPDKPLAATARARNWPIHGWTLPGSREGNGR